MVGLSTGAQQSASKLFFSLVTSLFFVFGATPAGADVIDSMPVRCPAGTEPRQSHEGPYCRPPLRADCPPGYEPRVNHDVSYCEPPPAKPCPKGLYWYSSGPKPGEGRCMLNDECKKAGEACSGGGTCEQLSFCLEWEDVGRGSWQVARGVCAYQAHCAAFPDSKCEKRLTCTNPARRKREAQRIEAAKKVLASAVPAPYEASWVDGKPIPYRIWREGQNVAALPEVPDPPDEPLPEVAVAAPDPQAPPVAPTSAPSASPVASPANPPQPTVARGGCAGCTVEASDADMAGFAALMTLVGVGIVVRKRWR